MTFATVLVANRGEIARRVMRTCRARGIRTVAVHSGVDADALHVREADVAVALPGAPVAAYLDVDAVVAAAVEAGADAIHPGYGFLSENADLPKACAAAGVTFVGPTADVIALMGDKAASKQAAADAGVPVLSSIDPADFDDDPDRLRAAIEQLGLPVIVKAVVGGGGKGMRRVDDLDDLDDAVAAAARVGASAFGDDRLLIERYVTAPRHVEVQVAGDVHGGAVHVFERDCSIQRRHQKVVEEAPSPALDADLRQRMGTAAVAVVEQVGYVNLGTVEFLLDTSGDGDSFFFLEMNTRLQVEHPVTELVAGLDLVGSQLDIAAGGVVPEVPPAPSGHAIEVRLYAEDVPGGFLPQSGTIAAFHLPDTVRVDSAVAAGSVVSSHYDPMLAKVIAAGDTREGARSRLLAALDDARVTGVVTNLDHLRAILASDEFASGEYTTAFLPDHLPDWSEPPLDETTAVAAAAALALDAGTDGQRGPGAGRQAPLHDSADGRRSPGTSEEGFSSRGIGWRSGGGGTDPWRVLGPWRGGGAGGWRVDFDEVGAARVTTTAGGLRVTVGPESRNVTGTGHDVIGHDVVVTGDGNPPGVHELVVDGQPVTILAHRDGDWVWVARAGHGSRRVAAPRVVAHRDAAMVAGDAALAAPMPGQVIAVEVSPGDTVAAGDTLVIVEAMKMEHPSVAPADGTVAEVRVAPGQPVAGDEVMVVLHSDGAVEGKEEP